MTQPDFCVLLGPDHAGKSSILSELDGPDSPWRCVSVDDAFLGRDHSLISSLRLHLVRDALPLMGTVYSADFVASLMSTAVVYLRDQILAAAGRPVLVDSYYYKIVAKVRLAGAEADSPMLAWWRTFPQPSRVIYLDVSARTAWRRCGGRVGTNRLEHYGEQADWPSFEAFQNDLGKVMLDEVRHLPLTVIEEHDSVARTVRRVRRALAG